MSKKEQLVKDFAAALEGADFGWICQLLGEINEYAEDDGRVAASLAYYALEEAVKVHFPNYGKTDKS